MNHSWLAPIKATEGGAKNGKQAHCEWANINCAFSAITVGRAAAAGGIMNGSPAGRPGACAIESVLISMRRAGTLNVAAAVYRWPYDKGFRAATRPGGVNTEVHGWHSTMPRR